MSEQYLNEFQVAERTNISLATLRRWRLESRGPKFRKFGSLVRYDKEELALWVRSRPTGGEDTTERFMPKPIRSRELLRRSG
jgi:predicted DNA-binding transcriptional regulator AlpA